jgi:hypothetical protein
VATCVVSLVWNGARWGNQTNLSGPHSIDRARGAQGVDQTKILVSVKLGVDRTVVQPDATQGDFKPTMQITPEQLAYWYLRLNGFLTIRNFIVHPDAGSDQRTDVDILGVRFPYRAELSPHDMKDDELFTDVNDRPYIVTIVSPFL